MLASIWMPDLATMRLVLPELLLVATLAVLLIAPIVDKITKRKGPSDNERDSLLN